jgi:hypothetical protein
MSDRKYARFGGGIGEVAESGSAFIKRVAIGGGFRISSKVILQHIIVIIRKM